MNRKRKLLLLILLILFLGALSFRIINAQIKLRNLAEFEQQAIEQFPTIREELEACIEIVIPALIEIDTYNAGRPQLEWKRTPSTPEIYELYRDQYSPELQEALETIWGFGVVSIYVSERVGELCLELKLYPRDSHFFAYYYSYNPTAPNASWSGKDDSYSTPLTDNWYFYSKPRGYFY